MTSTVAADLPLPGSTSTRGAVERADVGNAARRSKRRLTSRGATIASLLIAILWTIPTFGLFVTSLRPQDQITRSGWWEVFGKWDLTTENYQTVLGNEDLTRSFVNSIAITLPATIAPLAIAALAAYAFAWIDFRGKNILFIFVFALQIVPIQMTLVPLLTLFSRGLHVGNATLFSGFQGAGLYTQVWIAHTIFALPLAIFLLHNFIAEIPGEVIEAARVDGAGHGQIFLRIVLPLTVPAIASFAIFQFLWVWNDLLVALIFATGEASPITRTLAELTGQFGRSAYLLPAGAFIAMIVPLIVFFALQRFFVRGLLAGSTKG